MSWLQAADTAGFRLINLSCSNALLDQVMPWFSGNPLFGPTLLLLGVLLLAKGGIRGRLFFLALVTILALGEPLVSNMLKDAIGRLRPFCHLEDARTLAGQGRSFSMPSSHTSIWFAATLITHAYYPRSWRFMLPLASLVGLSRIYLGVHYPADILVGAAVGAGYAAAGLWSLNRLWQAAGPRWYRAWHQRVPSLILVAEPAPASAQPGPVQAANPAARSCTDASADQMWLRAGYGFLAVMLVTKLAFLALGKLELSEDEAYQWVWSKHLDWSYFSKPPLIAWTQFLGTSIWGDTEFGVRFFSPVLAAATGWMILRLLTSQAGARAGFWAVVISHTIPLLAVGSTLLTVDPLLVTFWTAAMAAGWRAVQPDGATRHWILAGAGLGLAFLSKYSALYQLVCWALFFILWPPARAHWRRPGPYLALGILSLCALPVLLWNAQHDWITLRHVAGNAQLDRAWEPTLRFAWDFAWTQLGLLNPVFLVGALWAAAAFWISDRRDPFRGFLFCMGPVVFAGHALYTLHARVQPNWIAPALPGMIGLMVVYWIQRWNRGERWIKPCLVTGLALGAAAVLFLHDTKVVERLTNRALPVQLDPLRRVRAWKRATDVVEASRMRLAREGKDVFLIGGHYGITGLLSFYHPEAKSRVATSPMVYYRTSDHANNQFYFWPGYRGLRTGQNALFVREVKSPKPPPPELLREFESVTDLGIRHIEYHQSIYHKIQIYACRNLLPHDPGQNIHHTSAR